MRIPNTIFMLTMFSLASIAGAAQSPASSMPIPTAAPLPSGLLTPSLDTVQRIVGAVKLEKWKKGTVRDEAGGNIDDIVRDLQTSLPPLLTAADAAPETISKMLPVTRNIDALYDVLLRVVEAARVTAPAEQVTPLEQSLISLGSARKALVDRLQDEAVAQEKQLSDLRSALQAQAATKSTANSTAATPACAAPTPTRKPRKKVVPPSSGPKQQPSPASAAPKTGD